MPNDREKTNIEIYQETWRRLNSLKLSSGDSFDDVINRLIDDYEDDNRDESNPGGNRE